MKRKGKRGTELKPSSSGYSVDRNGEWDSKSWILVFGIALAAAVAFLFQGMRESAKVMYPAGPC